MSCYQVSHLYIENHPVFLNVSVLKYGEDIKDHALIGSGKIYLCFVYGELSKINADGTQPEVDSVQIQPVENHFKMSAKKGAKLITMGMRPEYWYNITKVKARGFTGRHFKLEDAISEDIVADLYRSLRNIDCTKECLKILDNGLERFYDAWTCKTPLDGIITEVFDKKGKVSISNLLEKYPIGRSTLNAYFDTYIGLSPNFYTRLIHFNYILREHFLNQKCLAEIIRDWDYYDYSHFKKDFIQFTGIAPKDVENYKNESLEGLFKHLSYW